MTLIDHKKDDSWDVYLNSEDTKKVEKIVRDALKRDFPKYKEYKINFVQVIINK